MIKIIECPSCKGTGLYKGFAEKDNCAVVCFSCKGNGFIEYHYEEFNGIKTRDDVKRVFEGSFGYAQSDKDYKDGEVDIKFSQGGCSYEEWLNGETPKPVRELYCPFMWSGQSSKIGEKLGCYDECGLGGMITNCSKYNNKEKCWTKFLKEE